MAFEQLRTGRQRRGEIEYVVVGFEDATPLKEREDKLTSEKTRLLELYSERLFDPFLDAADGEVRIDVDEIVTLPDGTTLQYVTTTGISAKAVGEAFERQHSVRDVRLLRSTEGQNRLEVHVETPTVPLVFDELGGQVLSLLRVRSDDTPVLTGELPGDVDPRTAVQAARRVHPDIELVSQELRYSPHLLYDIVADVLTDKQFAALQIAYYGGYFDTPRTSDGDELAARLGITRQTFNQHLRKAERTVFEQLFEASGKAAR
ncbi:bacterio-opsin activator domain-containing protein [Halorussus caseinilyticus]|uniref:Bacterio-opsin activator domain-containing protein n=1 Tax=Halorussus caseinilyticus TaxID=3034025 RepID=A0ABD5WRL2_9EURY